MWSTYLTDLLAVVGALYTLTSVAASLLPVSSFQKFLANIATDLRAFETKV